MRKWIFMLLGLVGATLSQAAENRSFLLATAGEVDSALVEHLRVHLEASAGVAVRLAPAVPMEPDQSLDAIGRAAAKTLEEGDPGIIVLARPTSTQPQGVCLPWERFAVLNLAKLEVGVDAAQTERRAGQEGLRVMATLLGLSQCPFPLCVLVGYEKLEDLDRMSGSYCPPCQDRFDRLAREAGIRRVEPVPGVPSAPAWEPDPEPVAEPAVAP